MLFFVRYFFIGCGRATWMKASLCSGAPVTETRFFIAMYAQAAFARYVETVKADEAQPSEWPPEVIDSAKALYLVFVKGPT